MVPEAGPVACGAESCAAEVSTSQSFDFAAGCPASGFAFTGDPGGAGVKNDCGGGKVHVAATNGLGIEAVFDVRTPGAFATMHVSARIAVTTWDGGPMFSLGTKGASVAEIQAVPTPTGRTGFLLCQPGGACSANIFESAVSAAHVFALDVTGTTVSLSIDCRPFAKFDSNAVLPTNESVELSFGKTGANGIDGTLDDLFVSYR